MGEKERLEQTIKRILAGVKVEDVQLNLIMEAIESYVTVKEI